MNKRQEKAEELARWLGQMSGVWTISPMPLDGDTRTLRFQVLDFERDSVVTELCAGGWIPSLVQGHPRFTPNGLMPASLFEVEIPKERPPVVDDRPKIPSEIAELAKREERMKAKEFIAAFRKTIEGK
jgi:hypothetical protein